jgi:hypothetical protein
MKTHRFIILLVILSLFSFSFSAKPKVTSTDLPRFSFLEKITTDTSDEYIRKMEKYDRIIKKCPIPVIIIPRHDLPFEYRSHFGFDINGAYFYEDEAIENLPKEFIFINKDSSPENILSTYLHEYSHYDHHTKECLCFFLADHTLAEAHAIYNSLKYSLNYNLPDVADTIVLKIIGWYKDKETPIEYRVAALSVIQNDLFVDALRYLKDKSTLMTIEFHDEKE